MLEAQVIEGFALIIRNEQVRAPENGRVQPRGDQTRFSGKDNWDNRDNLWCTYYKKPRHTKEHCWKLNGKPSISSKEWSPRRAAKILQPSTSDRAGTSNRVG